MTFIEAKWLLRSWDQMETDRRGISTFSRANNVYYHFDAHGGRATLAEYMRAAAAFPRDRASHRDRGDGTTIYNSRDHRYLIVRTVDQRIVSYGENETNSR